MNCIKSSKPYLLFLGVILLLAVVNVAETIKTDNTVFIENTTPITEFDQKEEGQSLSYNLIQHEE